MDNGINIKHCILHKEDVKYREGKQWKKRICIIKKIQKNREQNYEHDILIIELYKKIRNKVNDSVSRHDNQLLNLIQSKDKYSLTLKTSIQINSQTYLGLRFSTDKYSLINGNIITILCKENIYTFSISTPNSFFKWYRAIIDNMGPEYQFEAYLLTDGNTNHNDPNKLVSQKVIFFIRETTICLSSAKNLAMKVLRTWKIDELNEFGCIDNKFIFDISTDDNNNNNIDHQQQEKPLSHYYILITEQSTEIDSRIKYVLKELAKKSRNKYRTSTEKITINHITNKKIPIKSFNLNSSSNTKTNKNQINSTDSLNKYHFRLNLDTFNELNENSIENIRIPSQSQQQPQPQQHQHSNHHHQHNHNHHQPHQNNRTFVCVYGNITNTTSNNITNNNHLNNNNNPNNSQSDNVFLSSESLTSFQNQYLVKSKTSFQTSYPLTNSTISLSTTYDEPDDSHNRAINYELQQQQQQQQQKQQHQQQLLRQSQEHSPHVKLKLSERSESVNSMLSKYEYQHVQHNQPKTITQSQYQEPYSFNKEIRFAPLVSVNQIENVSNGSNSTSTAAINNTTNTSNNNNNKSNMVNYETNSKSSKKRSNTFFLNTKRNHNNEHRKNSSFKNLNSQSKSKKVCTNNNSVTNVNNNDQSIEISNNHVLHINNTNTNRSNSKLSNFFKRFSFSMISLNNDNNNDNNNNNNSNNNKSKEQIIQLNDINIFPPIQSHNNTNIFPVYTRSPSSNEKNYVQCRMCKRNIIVSNNQTNFNYNQNNNNNNTNNTLSSLDSMVLLDETKTYQKHQSDYNYNKNNENISEVENISTTSKTRGTSFLYRFLDFPFRKNTKYNTKNEKKLNKSSDKQQKLLSNNLNDYKLPINDGIVSKISINNQNEKFSKSNVVQYLDSQLAYDMQHYKINFNDRIYDDKYLINNISVNGNYDDEKLCKHCYQISQINKRDSCDSRRSSISSSSSSAVTYANIEKIRSKMLLNQSQNNVNQVSTKTHHNHIKENDYTEIDVNASRALFDASRAHQINRTLQT